MKEKALKIRHLLISIFISLTTIFFKGIIKINAQRLSNMKTYSGGYPIAWFEYYYPSNINLSIRYVYDNFTQYYKIDIFAFFLNVAVIALMLNLLKKLYNTLTKS